MLQGPRLVEFYSTCGDNLKLLRYSRLLVPLLSQFCLPGKTYKCLSLSRLNTKATAVPQTPHSYPRHTLSPPPLSCSLYNPGDVLMCLSQQPHRSSSYKTSRHCIPALAEKALDQYLMNQCMNEWTCSKLPHDAEQSQDRSPNTRAWVG